MSSKDEDFVEVLSMILVYGKQWFDETVLPAAQKSEETDAYNALQQKLSIVETYMLNSWGIQFLDNEVTGERGLESYVQEAVAAVVATPPTE